MSAVDLVTTFVPVTCCHRECGMTFALPDSWVTLRRADHAWWYCPNGHSQRWSGKSEAERLRDEKAALERSLQWERDAKERATRRAVSAEHSARAHKGATTRIRNRVAAGCCPCCNRTFQNLARHMKGQHPDFGGTE